MGSIEFNISQQIAANFTTHPTMPRVTLPPNPTPLRSINFTTHPTMSPVTLPPNPTPLRPINFAMAPLSAASTSSLTFLHCIFSPICHSTTSIAPPTICPAYYMPRPLPCPAHRRRQLTTWTPILCSGVLPLWLLWTGHQICCHYIIHSWEAKRKGFTLY